MPHVGYDIEPECVFNNVIKGDYLLQPIKYLEGRLIIGNPPFGERNSLAIKFYKKSIEIADYISFILPISQYNNNQKMYEFDLVYSENLGFRDYSGIKLNCCFNIYKRPLKGVNTKPISYSLNDVKVVEFRRGRKNKIPEDYIFSMCTWGDCGKKNDYIGQYAQEHYIKVINLKFKDKILEVCNNTDWINLYPSISSAKLQTWKIYKHLLEQIPELR